MIILAVDDEKLALQALTKAIRNCLPNEEIHEFQDPEEALAFSETQAPDIAFLDIRMRQMSGIDLAKRLKVAHPRLNVIFTTGFDEYTGEALAMHVSGYIMKPVTPVKVQVELDNLRFPIPEKKRKHIHVQCFGNFEIFVDGMPVTFDRGRTKEVLAYLIDRGTVCTNGEIIAALWEDDHADYFQKLRGDLVSTLRELGVGDILITEWGKLGIVKDRIDCDYYNWMAGTVTGINAYNGEYMSQYSWAEDTHAAIEWRKK